MSLPNPETSPENRARIEREIQDAAKDSNTVLSSQLRNDLTEIVVAECTELRERIANRILQVLIDRGDGITPEQLERLQHVILFHYETNDGFIDVIETNDGYIDVIEPPEPQRKPLRRIK